METTAWKYMFPHSMQPPPPLSYYQITPSSSCPWGSFSTAATPPRLAGDPPERPVSYVTAVRIPRQGLRGVAGRLEKFTKAALHDPALD